MSLPGYGASRSSWTIRVAGVVRALAAASDAEAEREFLPRAVWRLGRDGGVYAPLPSRDEAAAYPFTPDERARLERTRAGALLGTGERAIERLSRLAVDLAGTRSQC